jgi:hypothetical protein
VHSSQLTTFRQESLTFIELDEQFNFTFLQYSQTLGLIFKSLLDSFFTTLLLKESFILGLDDLEDFKMSLNELDRDIFLEEFMLTSNLIITCFLFFLYNNKMSRYLTLDYYNGTLDGVQNNYYGERGLRVDKNLSPGGLSTLQHHWTEGLGGPGDITPDVFVGTGDRYKSGVYGNLYIPESHAAVHEVYKGPHTNLTENKTLSGKSYYWKPPKKGQKEGFKPMKHIKDTNRDFELIKDSPMMPNPKEYLKNHNLREDFTTDVSKWGDSSAFYFSLFVMVFGLVIAGFWHDSLRKFIEQYLNNSQFITWQKYGLYSVGLTILFLVFLKLFKVQKISVE